MAQQEKAALSVAVVTSTIGRAELARAIESVRAQTYPCKHYIFVDGEAFAEAARNIVAQYPEVIVIYLPMNTGAGNWKNSTINAIAPFLVKEDVICYLDDDNWFEPNHVEVSLDCLQRHNYDYVYSMRNFISSTTEKFICQDVFESIGHAKRDVRPVDIRSDVLGIEDTVIVGHTDHIDTNCFFFKRAVALEASRHWYSGIHNDNNVSKWLLSSAYRGTGTEQFTVNYVVDAKQYIGGLYLTIDRRVADGVSEQGKLEMLEDLLRQLSAYFKAQR